MPKIKTSFLILQVTNPAMFWTLVCDGSLVQVLLQLGLVHSGSWVDVNHRTSATFLIHYTGLSASQPSSSIATWSRLPQQLNSTIKWVKCCHKRSTWCSLYADFWETCHMMIHKFQCTAICVMHRCAPIQVTTTQQGYLCHPMQSTMIGFLYEKKTRTSEAGAEQAPGHIHYWTALVQLAAKCAKLSSGMQWQALQNRPII